MLVILFISVFEYTYFCFKSVFKYILHSLPWPYFHIYIIWSQQVFGVVARDFSLVFGSHLYKNWLTLTLSWEIISGAEGPLGDGTHLRH